MTLNQVSLSKGKRWTIQIKQELREGEMIPKGYGIAYRNMDRYSVVIYPIPFNLIIGGLRRVWIWLMYGHKLYEDGFHKGYNKGYSEGRDYAFNQFKKQVIRQEAERLMRKGMDTFCKIFRMRKSPKEIQVYFWKVIDQEVERIDKEI